MNLRVLLLVVCATMAAAAEPRLVAQADLLLGTARRFEVDPGDGARQVIAVTLVPGGYVAHLIDQPVTFPLEKVSVAQARTQVPTAVVAINGGYFVPGFQPLGLVRVGGIDRHPRADATVLSGLVAIDGAGHLTLPVRDDALTEAVAAFQSGPFIIDPGGAIGVGERPASAKRSVLALDDLGRVLVLATGALTLYQVVTLLRDHPHAFGLERVERALNLDGGPSTGLSLALDDPAWSLAERGPVRNVLVFASHP